MKEARTHAAPSPSACEPQLWAAWREEGDESARARLLEMHMPYAKVVAATYYSRRFHDEVEFDDYLQLASVGLVDAAERYDPAQGVQFRTFAARRMHGEILDGIERMTEKQQQIATQQRLLAQRRAEVRAMAQADSKAPPAQDKVLDFVAQAGLAFALGWLLDGTGMIQSGAQSHAQMEAGTSSPFYASTEIRQLRERIASVVKGLPSQERKVIHGHYFHQRPFEDIAREMKLTRGRISQIHHSALARLRDSLRPLGPLGSG